MSARLASARITEDEIRKFIAASDRDDASWDEFLFDRRGSATRIPQTPLWIAFLETCARWGELSKAAWSDVDLAKGILVLRAENTKSKRQRAVPLRTGLLDRLRGLQALQAEVLRRLPTVTDRVFLTPDASVWPWHTANIMRVFGASATPCYSPAIACCPRGGYAHLRLG